MASSKLRRPRDASTYLLNKFGVRHSAGTLAKKRCNGSGPAFVKVGTKDVAYPEDSLDAYGAALVSESFHSTSAVSEAKRRAEKNEQATLVVREAR